MAATNTFNNKFPDMQLVKVSYSLLLKNYLVREEILYRSIMPNFVKSKTSPNTNLTMNKIKAVSPAQSDETLVLPCLNP